MPGQNHEPVVVITMKDIYDHMVGLKEAVSFLPERVAALEKDRDDHEDRLRKQERRNWPLTAATVLLAAVMAAVAFVTFLLKF